MWIPGENAAARPQIIPTAVDNLACGARGVVSEAVRQLLPHWMDEVDPLDVYLADERGPHTGRPWLMTNMVASLDGATALDGVSGDLSSPGDRSVFRAVRAACDWVLVASATAIAERYRMPRTTAELANRRRTYDRPPAPGLAIVTASGRIDPLIPAFRERTETEAQPLVIAGQRADRDALAALDAEVVLLPTDVPRPVDILAELGRRGAGVVLSEGGPSFNGSLHRAGVIDEMCLTVSAVVAGGGSSRIVAHGTGTIMEMRLDRLLEQDSALFARYVRH